MVDQKTLFIVIFSICVISFTSCSFQSKSDSYTVVQTIDYESDLQSTRHNFENSTLFATPREIINVNDEYLMISDADTSGFIKVFKLPELEFLYSWGDYGRGPGEYEYLPLSEINTSGGNLILYEMGTRKLREYSVNDSTLLFVNDFSLQLKDQTHPLNYIIKISDELYFVKNMMPTQNSNHEFIALQTDNELPLFTFGIYPESDLEFYDKSFEYATTNDFSNEASKMAAFYYYYNRFKTFDIDGNLVNYFIVNDKHVDQEDGELLDFLYRSLKLAGENYLYVMAMNEFDDVIEENIETFRPSFEKWSWDGDQLNRSKFDIPIHNFVVSEKHGKIYAYSVLDIYGIYEFDLP